ncbi:MAG TPA: hypothetical protein VL991_04780 [Terracidiphilus sp.]|nr:hypothetical protein [Terracidiphilus sp.]
MKAARASLLAGAAAFMALPAFAQGGGLTVPKTIEAGAAFSIQSSGSGKGSLYIVGIGQALKRDIQLGETTWFPVGSLYNAGHYMVVVTGDGGAAESGSLDVVPESKPADLSFLARPSRLPVGLHDGITGAVYVFDAYKNLIPASMPVEFALAGPSGETQSRTVNTRYGVAWTALDSTPKQGTDKFVARSGGVSSERVIGQVPGDPCGLKMSAAPAGKDVRLQTDPVRDCSGNAVPDGTIVTFTEAYNGAQSTVDVPLKRGIAQVEMPAHPGATITVASGVILGNQIRWGR